MTPVHSIPFEDNSDLLQRWRRIEAKLREARPLLMHNGGVYEHRRPNQASVWVVRFRQRVDGKRRLRCVYLGEEILAEAARNLIQQWRTEAHPPRERQVQHWLRLTDWTASNLGYSHRARKRLKAAGEKAFKNPREALRFVYGGFRDPHIRDGGRPGRPAKSGLW
ncbi:MAG: hypothetical protein V2A79_02885 [Planctomycetota bacterium]